MKLIDLRHLGRERVIGSWLVDDVIVDPGPASCLPALLEGLEGTVPRALALTHIHLDHAGASGSLVERWPELEVWVHERGARHMADPSRLLASAARLYGVQNMAGLWGEVLPVPEERLRVIAGGERLGDFEVAYTPGHASHHVAYLHGPSRRAFTGDVAGVRVRDGGPVLAPTPPPDIDVQAWLQSIERVAAWGPRSLAPTHFGAHADPDYHLEALRADLLDAAERARSMDEGAFVNALRARFVTAGEDAGAYEQAMPPDQSYQGLLRYLRSHAEPSSGSAA